MAGQLIFQPPTFHWPSEDQQTAFEEWQSHVTLTLEASNIPRERWYASIIGFLGTKGFKWWQHLEISKDVERRKTPEDVFTAFTNTLEVSTSQWNYIDEMYSDIWQGEQETTDQLDQRIKILVEKCGYPSNKEKERCQLELLFHVKKHFEVKKWVRLQTALKETVTFDKLLQHAKQHEATIKEFHWHKSNGGVAMSTTINEIRTFTRKGQGSWARARTRSKGKICGKCGTSHPPRECLARGKKCHKCGNKNHFSTQCRSRQSGGGDRWSRSTSRGRKGKGKHQQSRSRSNQVTKSAHSIESASFQDHSGNPHRDSADIHGQQKGQTGDLHGASGSTEFLKQSFSTISRSKSVASISNDTDPEGKTKILTMLQLKLPHCNSTDNVTVKVDDGAEGNILPLNSFRAMFPHALDTNGYPKPGFLRGSKTTLECYDDGKLVNHGSIKLRLQHYSEGSFQDHSFYIVETKTPKPIIVGHPASIRLGLIWVLCKNISKSVLVIKKMTENSMRYSFQDHPIWVDSKIPWRWQRSKSESSAHSFQDHLGTGNLHGDKKSGKSVLSRPSTKCVKNKPKSSNNKAIEPQNMHKKGSFKTIRDGSKKDTSFKTIVNRVNNLNPQYMVPVDEATQVISDPKSMKKTQEVTEQSSSGPPPPGSRFNPIYVEPGLVTIDSTRDLQALYPNSFNCIGDMQGEYDIKTNPTVPPV